MTINPVTMTIRTRKLAVLIRDARQASGKSVEECARLLGIQSGAFEAYEEGEKSPSLPELEALAYAFKIPIERFFDQVELFDEQQGKQALELLRFIGLRQRIIGVLLRQARIEANLTADELANMVSIPAEKLEAYELGEVPLPLPELEALSGILNRPIRDFRDHKGVVGTWAAQQRAIQDFLLLPPDLQAFASKPVNRPYLELAQRLSEMSVEKLRAVAEGLLEITL